MASYSGFHMEGYITARVFAEAARRPRWLTPPAFADALRQMGEVDLGGFRVNFGKGNVGSNCVDMTVEHFEDKLLY